MGDRLEQQSTAPQSPSVAQSESAPQSESSSDTESAAVQNPAEEAASSTAKESNEIVVEHLFPDTDVIDIQTGQTLNLAAELAGGDRPILLWFWAPH